MRPLVPRILESCDELGHDSRSGWVCFREQTFYVLRSTEDGPISRLWSGYTSGSVVNGHILVELRRCDCLPHSLADLQLALREDLSLWECSFLSTQTSSCT